jgi:8-oxo-dGTP diphosphatase
MLMKKILFATGNPTKAKRFSVGLLKNDIEVLSLKDLNVEIDVEENGSSAIENALIKARACYEKTKMPVIGMDDTLYLDGVPEDKHPGMFVRRVNGKVLNDEEMIEHYTNLVKEYGVDGKLFCKWIYGMAVIDEKGKESTYTWCKDNFYMVDTKSEKINPGYPLNSISKYKGLDKYFTEVTDEDLETVKVSEDHVVDFIAKNI